MLIRTAEDRDATYPCFWCDEPMERQPTAAAVRFKGTGFHSVDYPKR